MVENPMVIDSLWMWRELYDEPKKVKVDIDVDTSFLSVDEVKLLINKLERLSHDNEYTLERTFTVDYDLDANRDADGNEAPIVLIELRGFCEEQVYDRLAYTLDDYANDWIEH